MGVFFWKNYGLRRRDGAKWTLDDELTLDEFGGLAHILLLFSAIFHSDAMRSFFERLSRVPLLHGECAPWTGKNESCWQNFDIVVRRKDGRQMNEQDEHALMEYAGIFRFLFAMTDIPLIGALDESPTSSAADPKQQGRMVAFPNVARRDGKAMTWEDECSLLEFGAFHRILSFFGDGEGALGLFPATDEDFTETGIRWGQDQRKEEKSFECSFQRVDGSAMTDEDEEGLLYYSAWTYIGTLMISIKRRIFGAPSCVLVESASSSSAIGVKGAETNVPTLPRKPSGAELNAWIGLAAQKVVGLDKPDRKVRTRSVL
jgi:hypothetical protein